MIPDIDIRSNDLYQFTMISNINYMIGDWFHFFVLLVRQLIVVEIDMSIAVPCLQILGLAALMSVLTVFLTRSFKKMILTISQTL